MNNIFHQLIFGPIRSRRLGSSLGINAVLPDQKYCNFNCVYCECGWSEKIKEKVHFPTVKEIAVALEAKLTELKQAGEQLNSITFSGNGEPTLHPYFKDIVKEVILLRDSFFPEAKISVLSNATMLTKETIREALLLVDNPILKLDAPIPELVSVINQPSLGITFEQILTGLQSFPVPFYLQTIFLEMVTDEGKIYNNFDEKILEKWLDLLPTFNLKGWMIYPLDRPAPHRGVRKLSPEKMNFIKDYFTKRISIPILVSY
jgi:wyosine [tRNA(Phe)-imidazoG37] synthetase (radical SAM superfamily)